MREMAELHPDETRLVGGIVADGSRVQRDAVSRRIYVLIDRNLVHLATREGGWSRLYRDPRDGRLWELTFPQGEIHGGGPPTLAVIDREAAAGRYGGRES